MKKAFAVEIGSVYNDDIINRTPRPSPVVHQVNAISMASVKATRNGLIDVLFLQPDHSLVVWTGGNTFFPLTMPINHQTLLDSDATTSKRRRSSLDSSEDVLFPNYRSAAMDGVAVDAAATSSSISSRKIFRSPSKSSRIVSIKDTVDNRVNLVLSNGVVLRATLDFCPRSHLVRTCFQALSYVLPDSTFELLRLRYLVQQFGSSGKQPQSRLQPVLQNGEWCNFLVAFFSFCHSKPSIMKTTRGGVSAMDSLTGNGGGYSSFAALLNSNYHHAFLSDPTLARLDNIFKFNSSESSSASSSRSTLEKYHDLSKELYLQHHTQPNFQFFLPLALLSLHLVYEDFKLNLVTQKYIQPLSHLLSCLAKALKWDAYLKHYHQDGTDMVLQSLLEGWLAFDCGCFPPEKEGNCCLICSPLFFLVPASVCEVPESLVASPPSIYSWFESIISNTTKPEPFPQISSLSGLAVNEKVTPLPPLGSLCSQTSLVVSFYNCLFHSSSVRVGLNNKNQRQILNEKLVEIMVKSNFKLKDVDRLPFGVALPLRQAIRSCRTTPPSSWGADAYALIGREDLAQQFTGRKISSPYSPIMNFAKTDLVKKKR